jgi:hypothetical protein
MSIPDCRECALLVLRLIESKEEERQLQGKKQLTRARISLLTLQNLWMRPHFSVEFLDEVNNWLFRAGWTLFFAGKTYAIVRVEAAESWVRISYKRIREEVNSVAAGTYNFEGLKRLLVNRTAVTSRKDDLDFDQLAGLPDQPAPPRQLQKTKKPRNRIAKAKP